jgi:hypothetical protein
MNNARSSRNDSSSSLPVRMPIPRLLFPVSLGRTNSVVFRLIRRLEFVDPRQNSIDPLSNEFPVQGVEITSDYTRRHSTFTAKSTIFVVFRPGGR